MEPQFPSVIFLSISFLVSREGREETTRKNRRRKGRREGRKEQMKAEREGGKILKLRSNQISVS